MIPNPNGITYMKVRADIVPTGLWASPESLNVPGQRFSGTVKDNHIEGEFEIEHRRYDGSQAPPFPPDFSRDPALKEFLEPSDLIQSADPELVEKAREITRGSKDSWEAAGRVALWVADNIKGAIPGGGTAKGVLRHAERGMRRIREPHGRALPGRRNPRPGRLGLPVFDFGRGRVRPARLE